MRNTDNEFEVEGSGSKNTTASLNGLKELCHLKFVDLHLPHAKARSRGLFFKKLERFRILIGQGWDLNCGSDSKTLKLKLDRSIQNVHGVKMFMKNV